MVCFTEKALWASLLFFTVSTCYASRDWHNSGTDSGLLKPSAVSVSNMTFAYVHLILPKVSHAPAKRLHNCKINKKKSQHKIVSQSMFSCEGTLV